MNAVTVLGVLSLVFCLGFTARSAASRSIHSGQSIKDSLVEAWTNIAIGFTVNYFANLVFLPMIGAELTAANNFWLGCIYTAISFFRQFILRRFFNKKSTEKVGEQFIRAVNGPRSMARDDH